MIDKLNSILRRLDEIDSGFSTEPDMNKLNFLRAERKDLLRELVDVKLIVECQKLADELRKPKTITKRKSNAGK